MPQRKVVTLLTSEQLTQRDLRAKHHPPQQNEPETITEGAEDFIMKIKHRAHVVREPEDGGKNGKHFQSTSQYLVGKQLIFK